MCKLYVIKGFIKDNDKILCSCYTFDINSNTWNEIANLCELRDRRMDGLPLMGNPLYTIILCALYVYVVKVAGPNYMKHRPPMNIKKFMIGYNAFQVILSGYIFVQVL